jgi:hypothetical protein
MSIRLWVELPKGLAALLERHGYEGAISIEREDGGNPDDKEVEALIAAYDAGRAVISHVGPGAPPSNLANVPHVGPRR